MTNHYRAIKIIKKNIKDLSINLNSFVVLTEVGSNNFIYTPIIPLLAGAKKVFAWVKDSHYGKGEEIAKKCLEIAKSLSLENKIEFSINSKNINHLKEADIITNSNFLRPINNNFLKYVKPNIAIPLMFESWEFRNSDIDLELCNKKKIKIAGTWENHPKLKIFDYVKELTLKMIFEAGYEIFGNKFIIWSNDNFGRQAKEVLELNKAKEVIITNNYKDLKNNIINTDVILIFDFHENRDYFGLNGFINIKELKKINKYFGIIHLCGKVDFKYLLKNNIEVYPKKEGEAQKMTFTLSHVGLIPVLNLLTAGFKVGQECLENNLSNLSQPINF